MSPVKIVMDSSMDIPAEFLKRYDQAFTVPMVIYFGENEYFDGETLTTREFYERFRLGQEVPRTATPMLSRVQKTLEFCAADGSEVVCLTLSSGLSGTCELFKSVAEELNETRGYHITVIDTLSASLGGGLLALRAAEMARQGHSAGEIASELNERIRRTNHVFTVDTLEYLWRGGRLSRTEAFVGNVLDIKPILHLPDDGHIKAFHKVRGRKKALQFMIDWVAECITNPGGQTIGLIHWDCADDAVEVSGRLKERLNPGGVMITAMSATIGVHTGPGLIGIVFESEFGRR